MFVTILLILCKIREQNVLKDAYEMCTDILNCDNVSLYVYYLKINKIVFIVYVVWMINSSNNL